MGGAEYLPSAVLYHDFLCLAVQSLRRCGDDSGGGGVDSGGSGSGSSSQHPLPPTANKLASL